MKGGDDNMLRYSKSGRFLGFVRDPTGRPVETAPLARRRPAQEDPAARTLSAPQPSRPAPDRSQPVSEASLRKSGQWWKAAISLGVQMAESEARHMLARKARQVRLSSPRKKPE